MIDVIPEAVDNPVTTGLTGAMNSVNNMPPLVQQMTSEDDLSADPSDLMTRFGVSSAYRGFSVWFVQPLSRPTSSD